MLYADIDGTELSAEGAQWNEAVGVWTDLQERRPALADNGGAIDSVIQDTEQDWYETDPDHEQSVVRWNRLVTGVSRLRDAVQNELESVKYADPKGATSALGWDELAGTLEEVGAFGFLGVEITYNTDLGGGHGTGTYWKVTPSQGESYSGSIPDSTHGRTDKALNGARDAVAYALTLHNYEVDLIAGSLTWPQGVLA